MQIRTLLMALGMVAGAAFAATAETSARSGTFAGASGHITTGEVQVVKTETGYEIRLLGNFTFDGAPDPRIGFGKNGKFADATDFEPLASNSGAQVYQVPAGIDPNEFTDVFVWCRRYAVPLGVASLE